MPLQEVRAKHFSNGSVYALKTDSGHPIETTDTFLPFYTKNAKDQHTNVLTDYNLGDRSERWMVGVSVSSSCLVRCKFCATGKLKGFRNLAADEIVDQVEFVLAKNPEYKFSNANEHKINYTRMGEPFLNIEAVRKAIEIIDQRYPNTHHYVSTIGIAGADYSWIKDNITLQLSLHSLDDARRNDLIPYKNKVSVEELGKIRTKSHLKTTINLTLVDEADFDIDIIKKYFDPEYFFIKLSPINKNDISIANGLGDGIIKATNLK
jgi:23S rRNA (adenine2503-C2)-methyltransferase